jgi:hypothetical protein
MTNEIVEPVCVVISCEASNYYWVWLAKDWDVDPFHHVKVGRKLIARAPLSTCSVLRDMLNSQLKEKADARQTMGS